MTPGIVTASTPTLCSQKDNGLGSVEQTPHDLLTLTQAVARSFLARQRFKILRDGQSYRDSLLVYCVQTSCRFILLLPTTFSVHK